MRKTEILKKMLELIDVVNSLQHQLEDLKRENSQIKEELAELESCKASSVPSFENIETINEGFTVHNTEIMEDEPTTCEKTKGENVLDYGSIAIGKVVQESIKYANLISESSFQNKKELLNLIMGKAEVTKSEIFSITESDVAFTLQKELIDAQCDEAIDYFKSAYGQIVE
ncbi:MAG: hypothetical protein J6Q74_01435 [Clostridia bacterium]|nr:hypothetical protein [Clostridia bacterium]